MIKKNNAEEGMLLVPFDHSGKKVVLHKKIMELVDEKTKIVKNLQGKQLDHQSLSTQRTRLQQHKVFLRRRSKD